MAGSSQTKAVTDFSARAASSVAWRIARTNHLYLVSRTGGVSVRVLNAVTGTEVGTLDVSGISGGTFALNMIAVGNDGAIYATNLKLGSASDNIFKVYKWEAESSAPVAIYNDTALSTARIGDSFNVIGGGASTRLVGGYAGGSGSPAGSNGFAIIDPSTTALTSIAPGGPPPIVGDFRLGLTLIDSDTILGSQGGIGAISRLVDFNVAAGTGSLIGSPTFQSTLERPMDFAVVGGVPLLATLETGGATGGTANTVHLYDMTSPAAPLHLISLRNTGGFFTANGNAVGSINWGAITGNTATLYAMNTNNGIQAFTVTVPEPASAGLLFAGLAGLGSVRLRRQRAA